MFSEPLFPRHLDHDPNQGTSTLLANRWDQQRPRLITCLEVNSTLLGSSPLLPHNIRGPEWIWHWPNVAYARHHSVRHRGTSSFNSASGPLHNSKEADGSKRQILSAIGPAWEPTYFSDNSPERTSSSVQAQISAILLLPKLSPRLLSFSRFQ